MYFDLRQQQIVSTQLRSVQRLMNLLRYPKVGRGGTAPIRFDPMNLQFQAQTKQVHHFEYSMLRSRSTIRWLLQGILPSRLRQYCCCIRGQLARNELYQLKQNSEGMKAGFSPHWSLKLPVIPCHHWKNRRSDCPSRYMYQRMD